MPEGTPTTITINGNNYDLIDELDNIPIVDSFVKHNKIGRGSGEARFYVGAKRKNNFPIFFENFTYNGFFLRQDFDVYLKDAQFEYEQKEQSYVNDITPSWQIYWSKNQALSPVEFFRFESANGMSEDGRYYIRAVNTTSKSIWTFFREVMLPNISYVSVLKLKEKNTGEFYFLFRPSLSYSFNPYYHPAKERLEEQKIQNRQISAKQKDQLVKARIGQGEYRRKLLEESSECIITRVNDERILIASHVKPWSVAEDDEKIDHNNGIVLTPTYDRLFDQGFISFENDGTIVISPYISPLNLKKMNLVAGKKYVLPPSEKRKEYLEYHRKNIYKK